MSHHQYQQDTHDFTQGSVASNILRLALPMTAAQLINVLYNVVDRMYIGRIPNAGSMALTGVGLTFPIISGIAAFSNLFGTGGMPLCSIARGDKDDTRAEEIMGNTFFMLLVTSVLITFLGFLTKDVLLYTFGASETTFSYAHDYLEIYLIGTVFVMVSLGMNGFINAQGFPRIGMGTVLIGAVLNIVLDPLFIFVFHMGVKGAAIATVISQMVSAVWVFLFLTGKKTLLHIRLACMHPQKEIIRRITALGLSGFCMSFTNSAVQVVCNVTLRNYGGDAYIGVMTIINSVREVLSVPVFGFAQGASPVISYNYGAGAFKRVKSSIRFMSLTCIAYTTAAWMITIAAPKMFIRVFDGEAGLLEIGVPAMRIYFFGFCFMALQFAGQNVFTALGKAKQAIFFSLLRKAVIVIPLTICLPEIGNLGAEGVFLAEPISNVLGGTACFVTMLCLVKKCLVGDNKTSS